jgi:hypothetical protein
MNAKRYFVVPYTGLNGLGAAHAGVRLALAAFGHQDDAGAWAFAAVGHSSVLAFANRPWPRRDSSYANQLWIAGAATAGLAALLPDSALPFATTAAVAGVGSLLNERWYSRFPNRASGALVPGRALPPISLEATRRK